MDAAPVDKAPPETMLIAPVPAVEKTLLIASVPVPAIVQATAPSVIVTGPANVETEPVAEVVEKVNVFPGELNPMLPVPAVKVKSSFAVIVKLPPVTLRAPEIVTSDPDTVLEMSWMFPDELWLTVTPGSIVMVPATPSPALQIKFPAVVLLVNPELNVMLRRALSVSVLVLVPVQVKGSVKLMSPVVGPVPPGVDVMITLLNPNCVMIAPLLIFLGERTPVLQ